MKFECNTRDSTSLLDLLMTPHQSIRKSLPALDDKEIENRAHIKEANNTTSVAIANVSILLDDKINIRILNISVTVT